MQLGALVVVVLPVVAMAAQPYQRVFRRITAKGELTAKIFPVAVLVARRGLLLVVLTGEDRVVAVGPRTPLLAAVAAVQAL